MKYDKNNVFYKILNKNIPSKILVDHKDFIVIEDINPQDKFHYLLISKGLFTNLQDMVQQCKMSAFKILEFLSQYDEAQIITNSGPYQEIPHLHFHILSKKQLFNSIN